MEIFSIIIGIIIIFLIVFAIIMVFKYPKQIFIDAPAGFLKISAERCLASIAFITVPIWLPIWFLDNHFKWGIFKLKFFKLFYQFDSDISGTKNIPDKEYPIAKEIQIGFEHFSKYLISSHPDSDRLVKSLEVNLRNTDKNLGEHEVFRIGGLTIVLITKLELYDFNLLIQCLDNDFRKSKNFGFATNTELSFFGITDKTTLNNIIGRTSNGDSYAFNLVNGQKDALALSKKISLNSKLSTTFFCELIEKVQAGNISYKGMGFIK